MGGYVRIDAGDVIDQLDDDDLAREAHRRNLSIDGAADWLAVSQSVYDYLCQGDIAEAKLALERALRPKWRSAQTAAIALAKARQAHA